MTDRYYHYDPETGMEQWHDGEGTLSRCHDAVGLITKHPMSLADFLAQWPDAHELESEDR